VIADCWLSIVDWKNKNWIPAFAGMTKEQRARLEREQESDSEIYCRGEPVCSPE